MNKKLIKKTFFKSIKLGTGKAYILQKKYPKIDFSKEIFKGSIKNYAIDPECEGNRAKYMYKLIKNSKNKNQIIIKILNTLEKQKNSHWDLEQMCELSVLFYKDGYKNSLLSLNKRFKKNIIDEFIMCGEEQIIKEEGLNGLLKVAEQNGVILEKDEEYWCDSFIVDEFQKLNKHINVYKQLKQKGRKNKYIRLYLKDLVKHEPLYNKSKKIKRYTYETVIAKIKKGIFYIREERASELKDLEVMKLAKEFITVKDPKTKELYLRFFSNRKFPLEYNYIFDIVKQSNPKGTRLKYFAIRALRFFKSKEIRNWTLYKIKKMKNPSEYICLLSRNYFKNDYKILLDLINNSNNFDYIHSLIFGLEEIYEHNKTKKCKKPLELMYNKMNCSLHRYSTLKILYENKVLNNDIFNELKYDCNSDIKKLYKQIKNEQLNNK